MQKHYKSGQVKGLQIGASMDYKSGQVKGLQIGAKRLQNGAGITNRGKRITNRGRDYKSGQGLQIGAAKLICSHNFWQSNLAYVAFMNN